MTNYATSNDREGYKLNDSGRKFYSSALGFKIANEVVAMAGYHLFLWERPLPFLELLPEDKRPLAKVQQTESVRLAKHHIDVSRWKIHLLKGMTFFSSKTDKTLTLNSKNRQRNH